jgi:hypothetical protein
LIKKNIQDGGANRNKSIFVKKIDFHKTDYNLGGTKYFYQRQTPKCCLKIPDIPYVFVKGSISKWQGFPRWR